MPRDGSDVYTQPFPDVTEGTTIESAVYNGFVADVAIDLNAPRPISSGGTGADNAGDAMNNLGGEGSKIQVTNYDSHNFTAGSFYSLASATAPPVAGHAFAGWCYPAVVAGVATTDLFIEARDRDDLTQPGALYARQRKAGVWSGWMKAAGVNSGLVAPDPATDNSLWWDPTQGKLFIRYNDGNTVQWVEAVAVPDLGPDDFVSVDVDQAFTETEKKTARSNIYSAPFDAQAYSGMQINGSMEVSQERGTTGTSTVNTYPCDGWKLTFNGTMAISAAQAAGGTLFFGFPYLLFASVSTAQASLGTTGFTIFQQPIEGWRIARLAWGTASAQPVTIGFWTAHHRTGVYSGAVRNSAANRCYNFTYTQAIADIPQYNTVTITGCPNGVWNNNNTSGLELIFTMGAGGDFTAPAANVWATGNYFAAPGQVNGVAATSDQFRLTGVVVLPGIEAPSAARSSFIMRPYDQELLTCQRYFYQLSGAGAAGSAIGVFQAYNTNSAFGVIHFPVQMRAGPTLSVSATTDFTTLRANAAATDQCTVINATGTTPSFIRIDTTSANLVAGNATLFQPNGNARMKFDARL